MTTSPGGGGASDLATFDVPDPPRPVAGWKLRCILSALPGLALAAGLIVALRVPHLFWVVEHHPRAWYDDGRSLGYIPDRVASWLERDHPPEALRPRVLQIDDPKVRGRFHRVLAGGEDRTQVDAMFAYARGVGGRYELEEALESMVALDAGRAAEHLVAWHETPEREAGHNASYLPELIATKLPPEALAPHAVKIADPIRRGRFHAALATTKDPAQLEAVLAYAETVVPTRPGAARPKEWGPLVESLAAFGPVATPRLEQALEQTASRALVSLAAEALRASDLPFLVARARRVIDEYDALVPQLARDAQLVSAAADGQAPAGTTAEAITAARARIERADAKAYLMFEMLRAMEPVKGDQAVDFCIVRGLSTFNREIAEWSALRIKERFTPDGLIDTLFSYIAQRTEFAVAEVDVYERLMRELGAPGAARVATNLDRLLREAGGDPDEVFWLYKKMGFDLLRELGLPDAVPVLRRYEADPGSYVLTTTTTDRAGRRTREQTTKRFADDVRAAIAAIEGRGLEGGR